jgi:two-component system, cell cycle sensor histidine kinase and response regulator CckA
MTDQKIHPHGPSDELSRLLIQLQPDETRCMEAVGMLAAGIAHDFNNLMTTVLGSASYLKAKCQPDHPDYESLSRIEQAADTAGRLAHQLLIYARGGKVRPRLVDAAVVIANAVDTFRPALPADVQLKTRIPADLGTIECDTTQVQQVIANLCRNAVEAMAEGGLLTIEATTVRLKEPLESTRPSLTAGEYVRVTVTDTGFGMNAETAGRAFEPFFTTKPSGYGLGLAAAYGTMKSHGGAISLSTRPPLGSTFDLWFPRSQVLTP